MIPLLLYAQAADLATFAIAVNTLGFAGNEYGIFANIIYPHFGLLGIYVGKIGIVAAWTYGAATWRRFTTFLAVAGIVIGTLGTLTNVASLAVSV